MPEPLPILQFNTIRLSHAHAGLFIWFCQISGQLAESAPSG